MVNKYVIKTNYMVNEKIGDILPEKEAENMASKENEKVSKKIKMLLTRSQEDEWEAVAWVQIREWNLKQESPLDEGELRKLFENATSQESNSREEDTGDNELKILKSIIFSEENLTYFLDQLKDVYVRVKTDKCFEIMRLDSGRFKSWIIKKYNDLTDNIPASGNTEKVLSLLRARAVYGDKKYELSIRGAYSGGCIWYDLVNDEYKAIKIDKTGWAIIDTPPILFKRNIQNEQIVPERGGSVLDLLKFVNIKGEKQ